MTERDGDKIYVQVTLSAMEEKARQREFGNLLEINDNHPKYVVALNDMIIGSNYKGIHYLNLADFLMTAI